MCVCAYERGEREREFVYRLRSAIQHLIATDIVSVLFCTVICMSHDNLITLCPQHFYTHRPMQYSKSAYRHT